MTGRRDHFFWGLQSPLAALSGGSLLVLASGRLSFALVCALALLWVYVLTGLILRIPFLPRWGGITPLLASFTGGLYILFMFFVNPILAMDTLFFLILCPLCCVSSGILNRLEKLDPGEAAAQSCREALVFSALILGLSLIREPLGYGCLSLPGIQQGIVNFIEFSQGAQLPVRIIASSSGALFLLGYGIALFRRLGGSSPEDADGEEENRRGGKP
ncbi:MAG: hypothetical protein LBF63_12210 [Treponema sp.]|jgi:hypothetical protein|nr:hypothetical protein [Treponema sp.]